MSAETKLELLGLIDRAVADGWAHARACRVLDLQDVRAHRWRARLREAGTLADRDPGGGAVHGLLAWEEQAILDLIERWGWVDRSHRKLAHRGSYTGQVFVSPSTLLRVALKHRVVLPGEPFRPRPVLPAMPQVPWEKNRIWIWDATHFTRSKRVAYAIVDVVTRYWIGYLLTSEQTSTQAQLLFARALEDQDLLDADGLPPVIEDGLPILVAWSDNGSEMTATDTRQFMALMAITQHHGRPGTPTDQAHIESFFSHLKGDWPHLTGLTDPAARWPDDRDPRGILPSRAREQNGGMAETLDEPDREHRSDPEPGPVTFPSRPTYINRSYWLGIPRSRITPTTQTNWSFVSWPSVVLFVLACWLLPDHGFWPDVLFWMAAALMVWRGWRRVRASAGGNTAAVESELPASQAQHSDRR